MRQAFQRTDRVSDSIRREVADILERHVKDPRVALITITHVHVARDLKQARIYFTCMREGAELQAVHEGLKAAAGFVQRKLGERLRLRYTPHLCFSYDASVARGIRMNQLLTDLERIHENEQA